MNKANRQWRLANYPDGMPTEDNWIMSKSSIPEPGENEVVAEAIYLDVAPYMRGRISPQKNYTSGVGLGDLMVGGAIGQVVNSNVVDYPVGQLIVTGNFGWQEYAALKPNEMRKVDTEIAPLPCWFDFMGTNGITAYFGLIEVGSMKVGDTVVISAAAGSVGQIAGQIAKLSGCRAIAITSSEEKLAWCQKIGYDDGINYKTEPNLVDAITKVCPNGVDLYFDNTAGPIHDAVMQNLATFARIVVCGTVSLADRFDEPDIGERFLRRILVARARVQGFIVDDYQNRHQDAWKCLANWYQRGLLNCEYDIIQDIHSMPSAFLRLLNSQNLGKQLVQVSTPSV
ncbi:NADP-dependent oxidoreductase [Candidatus Poribacteria bacterium]|nr:NADP-dependent oxidoreductase [Candidatus Poribacteria bacterium]